MKEYLPLLPETDLFRGVDPEEIAPMLRCLDARTRTFPRDSYIFRQGDPVRDIMVLAAGKLHIRRDDYWGNSNIISTVDAGELFGEAYMTQDSGVLLHHVVAAEDSTVLFLDARRVITTCPSACPFHARVVQNLFCAISDKNRRLVQKICHLSGRTTREKLMSYLSEEAKRQGGHTFVIPFNRQQLADFLSVERSAMSAELGKMRNEGMIRFEKSKFTLITEENDR